MDNTVPFSFPLLSFLPLATITPFVMPMIIGAHFYGHNPSINDSARDSDGHGSHTASTAAGNKVRDAVSLELQEVQQEEGSHLQGFLFINFAIGSFHAMAKGILTVQSAGNYGPGRGSISSIAPRLPSVAVNTIDRRFINKVSLGDGRTLVGKSINGFASNGKKFPIIDGVKASLPHCEDPQYCYPICLDEEKIKGKILLCPKNVDGAIREGFLLGPSGFIVLEEDIVANVDPLPSSYVDINAPLIASFSSRGPNEKVPEIMKPDISAPGVNILAAYPPIYPPSHVDGDKRSVNYSIISGTSMSCPHVAGVAAYIKSFHPDWSPAAIKSAIMTTAKPMNSSEDKEFAYGSGHLNPIEAVNPGLVYELSRDDYVEMLCNIGYNT
ncbi:hypothetical protein L6164_028792 [Bauhinia variegata]|uniref:Uncharacterized protein n=1 Tax=Bauhinia variegata TaxID=167791 RepID=A0ACB9L794_BAUVA|nr:hypothetical protein L6164_028792 [Bauhinia variegata]